MGDNVKLSIDRTARLGLKPQANSSNQLKQVGEMVIWAFWGRQLIEA
jgi:hypothetical protein